MKNKLKIVTAFILGLLVSGVAVYAASLTSSSVTYDNTESGLTATNVQDALDELYTKANSIECKKGYAKNDDDQYGEIYECVSGWKPTTYYYTDPNNNYIETSTSDVSTIDGVCYKASDELNNYGIWFIKNGKIFFLQAGNVQFEQAHIQQIFLNQDESCYSDDDGTHCTSPNVASGYDVTVHVYSNGSVGYSLIISNSGSLFLYGQTTDSNGNVSTNITPIEQ